MTKIRTKWRSITIIYLLISYLGLVVFMHQPLSTFFLTVLAYVILFILVFLGTFIGVIGVLMQVLAKKESLAISLYRIAYNFNTTNTTVLASYGLVLLRRNDPTTALNCFNRGLESTNHFLTVKTLMGNKAISYWKLDELDQAISLYLEMIKKFGSEDQAFLTESTYTDEAVEVLVDDNPYLYPQDYTTLGYLYILKADYEKATFFTKAAMIKEADFASAYDNLGQIAYFQEDYIEAKKHFEKALELNPSLPDSLYFLGLLYIKLDDKEVALTHLNDAKNCKLDGLNTITYKMIDEAITLSS